jgi:hypothetical protein
MLAAFPELPEAELVAELDRAGPKFAQFIVDHGLGPLWHERTGHEEFRASRMQAEALYIAQDQALRKVTASLEKAGIDHIVIKGAANRLFLYDNPAIRACHDLDLLVRPDDGVAAATVLIDAGFQAQPKAANISIELLLTRNDIDIDLHWRLLRDGRLATENVEGLLQRRRKVGGLWVLHADDGLFYLLLHSAFTKHLAGWQMGLHRVADIVTWLRTQTCDLSRVYSRLSENGVGTAAWATLRWTELVSGPRAPRLLNKMLEDLQPGRGREAWLDFWLRNDLPNRIARARWARLLGFSLFLHDTAADAWRAAVGRRRALRRSEEDLAAFRGLLG